MLGLFTKINIGSREFLRAAKVRLITHRYAPIPICIITIQDPRKKLFNDIKKNEIVSLTIGYRGGKQLEWKGSVSLLSTDKNGDQTQIFCDGIEKCFNQKITQTWINEQPHAIVEAVSSLTGLSIGRITPVDIILEHMIADDITIWEVVNRCQKSLNDFGINTDYWAFWIGKNGINWGPHFESGELCFDSGDNLISLTGDFSDLTAVFTPDLRVSMKVNVKEKNRKYTFGAKRVIHEISNIGRTMIQLESADG